MAADIMTYKLNGYSFSATLNALSKKYKENELIKMMHNAFFYNIYTI